MQKTIIGIAMSAAIAAVAIFGAPASAKTAKECNIEYTAKKAELTAAKTKKADFIKTCRAEAEPAAGAPAPAPTQATMAPKPTASAPMTASEAQAQAKCPGGTVVWVNTKSRIYHFKGTRDYGNTKSGTYMCETEATAAGDRAAKNEKHP